MFRNRESMKPTSAGLVPPARPGTYNDVRSVTPGYDPYFLEQEWRVWWVDGQGRATPGQGLHRLLQEAVRAQPQPVNVVPLEEPTFYASPAAPRIASITRTGSRI